ncbi:MAG: hypothetical protein GX116_09290 [Fibrobacter sp.]|mgnify:CR=1 FL=1|jgi:hypothetical protein|nr:hypothetical protein [Fibrobacter sp.]
MQCLLVSAETYKQAFEQEFLDYRSVAFNELNASKVHSIQYLLFQKNKKNLAGISFGQKGSAFYSPFSAPFGGFIFNKELRIEDLEALVDSLIQYVKTQKRNYEITFPPLFLKSMDPRFLFLLQKEISAIELNYVMDLKAKEYQKLLTREGRRNLNKAKTFPYSLVLASSSQDKELAYQTIAQNRKEKSYPLKMSLDDLKKTGKVMDIHFFNLYYQETPVASAIVYLLNPQTAHLIYWGDLQDFSKYRPMNFLAFSLFHFYKDLKYEFLDLGPSSENTRLNSGLSHFKEVVGAFPSLKYSVKIQGTVDE